MTALITPFTEDGVDFDALVRIAQGAARRSSSLVALGTTAETCTLGDDEQDAVVRCLLGHFSLPLVVGVSGNDTRRVVRNALHWQEMGAAALLCITPYYNRCNAHGLTAHYEAICRAVDVPVILYNVPSRTGVNIPTELLPQLLALPHVAGIKEASADPRQIMGDAVACARADKALLCGEDALLPLFRAVGAAGAVSAAANAIPDVMADALSLPMAAMPRWTETYYPLVDSLFADVNPICVKQACYHLGLCRNILRLPLTARHDDAVARRLAACGFAIVMD